MTKLAPHVQDFSTAVQEAHDKDLAFGFQNPKSPKLASASEITKRYTLLMAAIEKRQGVEVAAAYLGSALTACFVVGDDEIKDPQMDLFPDVDAAAAERANASPEDVEGEDEDEDEDEDEETDDDDAEDEEEPEAAAEEEVVEEEAAEEEPAPEPEPEPEAPKKGKGKGRGLRAVAG